MNDNLPLQHLTEVDALPNDPLEIFSEWFEYVKDQDIPQHNAMTLATVSKDGQPNARIVLLKHYDERGFVFFTNYTGVKARELAAVNKACLVFYWHGIHRQIRIRGEVTKTTPEESQVYFSTRPRDSQIGAIASKQGQELASRDLLEQRFAQAKAEYKDTEVISCPEYWGGYRLQAQEIEFWVNGHDRLHDRFIYQNNGANGWEKRRLYP